MEQQEAFEVLARALRLGLDFKYRSRFMSKDVPDACRITDEPLPKGTPLDEVLEDLRENYLPGFPNLSSPQFAGFPDSGNSAAGIVGAILADLLNVNMINSTFCSRGATEMEITLIGWLRELIGFKRPRLPIENSAACGGIPTHGGTAANFSALLLALARQEAAGEAQRPWPGDLAILIPEDIGHYTVRASAGWAGLASTAVVEAPVSNFRYDLPRLRERLVQLRATGRKVVMVVAYAGDSRTMTIEDLPAVAHIVRDIFPTSWLHCDGCHGTSLLFSDGFRNQLDGIAEYDSVAMDPHKVLSVPYTNSFLLVRNPEDLMGIATDSELIIKQARSMGQITPVAGSRAFHSLRTWLLLRNLGIDGVGRMIEQRIEAARSFANLVDRHPRLQRLNEVAINAVAFTVLPRGCDPPLTLEEALESSRITKSIYDRMLEDGSYYLHSFLLPDSSRRLGPLPSGYRHTVLRYMSGNGLMARELQEELLEHIMTLAQ